MRKALHVAPSRLIPAAALIAALLTPLAASAQVSVGPYTPVRLPAPVFGNGQPIGQSPLGGRRGSLFLQAVRSLNLAPAQRQRIENLVAQRRAENQGRDKAARKADNRRMREEIRSLLSPQQRAELQGRLRQERGARRGNGNVTRVENPE
jgi:Spy/CpxP family protein refolding chaperone